MTATAGTVSIAFVIDRCMRLSLLVVVSANVKLLLRRTRMQPLEPTLQTVEVVVNGRFLLVVSAAALVEG